MTDERILEGARLGGRRRYELYGNLLTREDQSRGGYTATHLRYHKIKANPKCPLCKEKLERLEQGVLDATS